MPKADRFAQSRKAQPLAALQRRPIFCNKKHPKSEDFRCFVELLGGFEPPTSSLPRMRSTY